MCRIANKLTEVFKTFVKQLVSSITHRIDTKLADFHMSLNIMTSRMDALESQVNRFSFPSDVTQPAILDLPASSSLLASSNSTNATQQASTNHNSTVQVMMAVELENAERLKRQRNVIVIGLAPEAGTSDAGLFTSFCENNLTIKPRPVSCHRVSPKNSARDQLQKLKVTLNNTAAEELFSASQILRESDDEHVKSVFINEDLTPMEAQLSYDAREQKRKARQPPLREHLSAR